MSLRIAFDAGAAEWALAAAAAAAFLLLWARRGGAGRSRADRDLLLLRLAALALVLLAALKPVAYRLEERLTKPRLAVVLDAGPSMASPDDRRAARLTRAARWLKERRPLLEERAEVALFFASAGARRASWEELESLKPQPQALEPASAFSDVAASGPPFGRVWLLSDGAFEPGEALDRSLAALRAPVDALGVGPRDTPRGVAISALETPDFVFQHGRFPVSVQVEADQLQGGSLSVRLLRGGEKLGERSFRVSVPYETFSATFTVAAGALGRQSYRLEAVGSPGSSKEAVRAGRQFAVEVIRQKHRIMYLAGRPSFEYSHLRHQLKSDPNHELVSFVILRNPENVSPVPDQELSLIPFPAAEIFVQSLFQFDLFILENFAYWRFALPTAYLENLKRFVHQGGALLVLGGENAFTQGGYRGTPLEETLPVTLLPEADDYVPETFSPRLAAPEHPLMRLAETPAASAELWSALPPLEGFSRFASVRPGASVLLSHPDAKTPGGQPLPVVAVREFGRGKVMLVGTDSTWRWKLGGGRDWKVAPFYGRFWSRAVQYLTGTLELKKVKFSPLPDRMPPREPAVLSLHVFDEHFRPLPGAELDLRLSWKTPDGARRSPPFFEREPGVFQVELAELPEGRHRVEAYARYRGQPWGQDAAEFLWERRLGQAPLDRKRLKALADAAGGRYADLDRADAEEWLKSLPPVRAERRVKSRGALWTWPGWLFAAAALMLAEWALRRRRGYL